MRKAFSMLTAIVVIVMMASIAAMVFNLSGKIIKQTTSQYRKEQSMLLAKSYTEFAILAIQGHDMATNGCLQTITGIVNSTQFDGTNAGASNDGEGYKVTIRMQYIGLPVAIACPVNAISFSADTSVIVDVWVRYKDPDAIDPANSPWISYRRRTLQRL